MSAIATAADDYHDGYSPRQTADVQRDMNAELAEIVDESTGQKPYQNATDDTKAQQFLAIVAEAVAITENAAKAAFDMRDPLTAVGAGLSALVQLNAITRNPGSSSIITLTLGGRPGTVIPDNSLVSTPDNAFQFQIRESVVIPNSGSVIVPGYCTVEAPIDPEPGTVVVISTPVSGWNTVTNGDTISVGTFEETDDELRRRQQQSTNNTAYRHIEAIRAAVLDVPGVTFCRAYQNSTLLTDDRGIPGKEVACVVVGGDSREIANALFHEFGIAQVGHGNVTEVFYDDQMIAYPISFSRPVEREISVLVELEIVVDEGIQIFPSNGPDLIVAAILNFAATGHTPCEPLGNTGFPPGQDIIRSYLYTPINSVGGSRVVSVQLGVDGGPVEDQDISIAWDEVGIFSADRIEVTFA